MSRFIPAQLKLWTGGLLVQTPEAQNRSDRFYRGISTDTRSLRKGEAFLALKGDNFDGHNFVKEAMKKKAELLILDEKSEQAMQLFHRLREGDDLPDLLLVDDTLKAYQKIAEGYRQTLLATVIGVTGSVGKTTTRRMVSTILQGQVKVHETADNKNNQIGLPYTLLGADDSDDVVLAEMGMDRRGEIAILSGVAHPDISIITSIGYSHAEYLGSRQNILREKTDIVLGMKKNGLVLINGQDTHLNKWAKEATKHLPIWRIMNEDSLDNVPDLHELPVFWAENLKIEPHCTTFTARTTLDPAVAWPVNLAAPGKHLVRAALFGLATAYFLGLNMDTALENCHNFVNTGNRQRMIHLPQCLIINDSYNSSPESNTAALETLALIADSKQKRKIVCLGGMKELGQYSRDLHIRIGEKIAEVKIDSLYLVGEETRWVEEGVRRTDPNLQIASFTNAEALRDAVLANIRQGDCVLVQGSRSYRMELIADAIENLWKRG